MTRRLTMFAAGFLIMLALNQAFLAVMASRGVHFTQVDAYTMQRTVWQLIEGLTG